MLIRAYSPTDAQSTLDVFLRAIRVTAIKDYSADQVAAWARDDIDIEAWNVKRSLATTLVADIDDGVAGFSDLDDADYIDMMFVDPNFARQGVASALLEQIVSVAKARDIHELTTFASLTALPFFERHGFEVMEQHYPVRRGVEMTNFSMRRDLNR